MRARFSHPHHYSSPCTVPLPSPPLVLCPLSFPCHSSHSSPGGTLCHEGKLGGSSLSPDSRRAAHFSFPHTQRLLPGKTPTEFGLRGAGSSRIVPSLSGHLIEPFPRWHVLMQIYTLHFIATRAHFCTPNLYRIF